MEPSKRLKFGDVISGTPETSAASSRPGKVKTKTENGVTYMWDVSESKWVRVTMPKGKSSSTTSAKDQKSQTKSATSTKEEKSKSSTTSTPKRKASTPTANPPMAKAAPLQRKETKSVEGPAVKKQGVQTKSAPSTSSTKSASSEGSGNKRIDRIKRRAEKKVSRIENRRGRRENIKQTKNEARAMIRNAKGKPAKMQQGDFKDTSTNVDFGKPSEMSPKDARKNARAQTKAANKQYRKNVKAGLEKPVTPAIGNIRKKGGLIDRRKRK